MPTHEDIHNQFGSLYKAFDPRLRDIDPPEIVFDSLRRLMNNDPSETNPVILFTVAFVLRRVHVWTHHASPEFRRLANPEIWIAKVLPWVMSQLPVPRSLRNHRKHQAQIANDLRACYKEQS